MIRSRTNHASTTLNGEIYVIGGTTADHVEVEHYDPYNNTWNLTCPALKYVTNFTATACHGKLYVIGSCAVKYNALTMQCYNPVIAGRSGREGLTGDEANDAAEQTGDEKQQSWGQAEKSGPAFRTPLTSVVDFILVNDLAGGKMYPTPEVVMVPIAPFELVFGHNVRGPLKVLQEKFMVSPYQKTNIFDFVTKCRTRLRTAGAIAKSISAAQELRKDA
ncbi:Kelch-like protein 30 [Takifugu flavidus]|uniref:Kelch-like protein 30 n=1 Tax=Takifugu flavidus TaxID=433684 RepID=A0A5C6MRG4_9TELE|nr:Kelch-like protein 30 [Takifugu flavidus]